MPSPSETSSRNIEPPTVHATCKPPLVPNILILMAFAQPPVLLSTAGVGVVPYYLQTNSLVVYVGFDLGKLSSPAPDCVRWQVVTRSSIAASTPMSFDVCNASLLLLSNMSQLSIVNASSGHVLWKSADRESESSLFSYSIPPRFVGLGCQTAVGTTLDNKVVGYALSRSGGVVESSNASSVSWTIAINASVYGSIVSLTAVNETYLLRARSQLEVASFFVLTSKAVLGFDVVAVDERVGNKTRTTWRATQLWEAFWSQGGGCAPTALVDNGFGLYFTQCEPDILFVDPSKGLWATVPAGSKVAVSGTLIATTASVSEDRIHAFDLVNAPDLRPLPPTASRTASRTRSPSLGRGNSSATKTSSFRCASPKNEYLCPDSLSCCERGFYCCAEATCYASCLPDKGCNCNNTSTTTAAPSLPPSTVAPSLAPPPSTTAAPHSPTTASPPPHHKKGTNDDDTVIGIGAALGAVFLIVMGVCLVLLWLRRRQSRSRRRNDDTKALQQVLLQSDDKDQNLIKQVGVPAPPRQATKNKKNEPPFSTRLRIGVHFYLKHFELGRGGQGTVWLAHRQGEEQEEEASVTEYAIKELVVNDAPSFQRAIREVATMEEADHPNVVKLADRSDLIIDTSGRTYGTLFLVLPRYKYDLVQYLDENSSRAHRVVCQIMLGVTRGLRYTQEVKNIVHRDLKPSNILLNSAEDVVVADFGLATLASTSVGGGGSPAWMAPEQLQARRGGKPSTTATAASARRQGYPDRLLPEEAVASASSASFWMDNWALGCILFAIISHQFRSGEVVTWGRVVLQEVDAILASKKKRGKGKREGDANNDSEEEEEPTTTAPPPLGTEDDERISGMLSRRIDASTDGVDERIVQIIKGTIRFRPADRMTLTEIETILEDIVVHGCKELGEDLTTSARAFDAPALPWRQGDLEEAEEKDCIPPEADKRTQEPSTSSFPLPEPRFQTTDPSSSLPNNIQGGGDDDDDDENNNNNDNTAKQVVVGSEQHNGTSRGSQKAGKQSSDPTTGRSSSAPRHTNPSTATTTKSSSSALSSRSGGGGRLPTTTLFADRSSSHQQHTVLTAASSLTPYESVVDVVGEGTQPRTDVVDDEDDG